MYLLKGLLGTVSPVKEIPEVDKEVNRPEILLKGGGTDAGRKCSNRSCIGVYIGKNYCTHTGGGILVLHSHINH